MVIDPSSLGTTEMLFWARYSCSQYFGVSRDAGLVADSERVLTARNTPENVGHNMETVKCSDSSPYASGAPSS